MSICSSRVARDCGMPLQKPKTVLVLDHSNFKFSALGRNAFVDVRGMVQSLSESFAITRKMAFIQPNALNAFAFLEGLGFEVLLRTYNADSLLCLMVGELLSPGSTRNIDAIIVCSMDGGFACIDDMASQRGVEVFYVGFQDSFSFLLRRKNLIPLESLNCIRERKPKCVPADIPATSDSVISDQEAK